jgi:hypothetical protein
VKILPSPVTTAEGSSDLSGPASTTQAYYATLRTDWTGGSPEFAPGPAGAFPQI